VIAMRQFLVRRVAPLPPPGILNEAPTRVQVLRYGTPTRTQVVRYGTPSRVQVVPPTRVQVVRYGSPTRVQVVPYGASQQEVLSGEPPPKRGAVLSDDAELEKRGFTVGKTLGEGAFGKVKGAFIRKSQVLVAIKTIDRSKVAGKVSESDLLQERSVHAKLKHKNIIKILSHFEVNNKVSKTENTR